VLAEMVERARTYRTENSIEFKGYRLLSPVFEMKTVRVQELKSYKSA
jgi:hypothetical protein